MSVPGAGEEEEERTSGKVGGKTKGKIKGRAFRKVRTIREGSWTYKMKDQEGETTAVVTPEQRNVSYVLKLRDDPAESGMELARGEDQLPSDGWRSGGEVRCR